jgi:fibronectin type 3 domain-containing protein
LTFPLTLNPGQTATLSVAFNPITAVLSTGTLTISSNSASNGTVTIALSGTGISVSYDVDLSWSAPTDNTDPVSGYRIYRAPTGSSTYQVLNSSLNTPTTFTDASVVSGTTYQYYVTSVDAAGAESVPSNIATIAIP